MNTRPDTRSERDTFGPIDVPAARLWGAQTQRSIVNFPIGIESDFRGVVDVIGNRAIIWHEETLGAKFSYEPIPDDLADQAAEYRRQREHRHQLATFFGASSVEAILERLDRDGGEFARATAQELRTRSPNQDSSRCRGSSSTRISYSCNCLNRPCAIAASEMSVVT